MKTKKQLFIWLIAIIIISVIYLLVNSTSYLTKTIKKVSIPTKESVENSKLNQQVIKTEQIFKQNNRPVEEFNPPSKRGKFYLQECGVNSDDKNSNLYKKLQKDGLSEIQLLARDSLIKQCNKWYNFYSFFTWEEVKEYHKGIEDAQVLNDYFDNPPENLDGKILKKDAHSVLASGGDETYFTYSALRYLFKHDYRFLKRIADEINIQSISYLRQMSGNIISLYQCSVSYEAECSANSMVMMSLCIEDEKMCGMSFDQIIASWVPANSYSDLLHVVDIIRSMVRQGFFDDALDEMP